MAKIKICKNGPYLISDCCLSINEDIVEFDEEGYPLNTKKGKTLSNNSKDILCRCGKSKNKPFCDSTHNHIGFDGTENPNARQKFQETADILSGPGLILKDNMRLCSNAGFCHRDGGVWNLTKRSDNLKNKETAIEEACCCPSGRLVAHDKKTSKPIEPKLDPSIGVPKKGPLCVKGGVPIESSDGFIYEVRNRVTLCCCGKSRNKPFCDGSHSD